MGKSLDELITEVTEVTEPWYKRVGTWLRGRWWEWTYPIRKMIYGRHPKVNWERGNMYLFNFDASLAAVIRDGIAAFRKHNISVIYVEGGSYRDYGEDDNVVDKTEWLFDELIWTFDTIANGGVRCLPDVEALMMEAYGESEQTLTPVEGKSYSLWSISGVKEDAKKEMRRLENEYQERVERGLKLFAEHFERLWI